MVRAFAKDELVHKKLALIIYVLFMSIKCRNNTLLLLLLLLLFVLCVLTAKFVPSFQVFCATFRPKKR